MKLEERPESAPGSLGGTMRFLAFALVVLLVVFAILLVAGMVALPILRDAAWRGGATVAVLAIATLLVAMLMRRGR